MFSTLPKCQPNMILAAALVLEPFQLYEVKNEQILTLWTRFLFYFSLELQLKI